VFVVIPGEEVLAEAAGILNRAEAIRIAGPVLHRFVTNTRLEQTQPKGTRTPFMYRIVTLHWQGINGRVYCTFPINILDMAFYSPLRPLSLPTFQSLLCAACGTCASELMSC